MSGAAGGSLSRLAGEFSKVLAQVVESMTDQPPEVTWEPATALTSDLEPGSPAEPVWWEQPFQILPQPLIWLGAARTTWEELGARTLRAVGLENVEAADARSTWLEIVGQAVGGLARWVAANVGEEVTCARGQEGEPPQGFDNWVKFSFTLGGTAFPVWVAFAPELRDQIHAGLTEAAVADSREAPADSDGQAPADYGRTMDLLLDVDLPVSISFGRTQIPLRDVLKLTTGSIVELNRGVGEPVEVLVNHSLIARGEVVVIDGNYGVKIHQIVRAEDRLRSVR